VVFLITGVSKSSVLDQIIHKKKDFKEFPASYIHAQTTNADFYLDKAAAEKLS
jgi:6-phosphogluconolactonase/glucosamine-6-phosphate isomerase/deaminase